MTLTVTRVTHACVLLDFAGQRVLTDPWFSERRGYYRGEPLAFSPDGLPELAGVLVTHGHYDHFDLAAFAAYPDRAVPFVVKRGLAAQVRQAGFANVTEVDPWEQADLGGLRVTACPRSASSSRGVARPRSSAGTPCASPHSTRWPGGIPRSTWRCCRSTGWRSGPRSTARS